MSNHLSEPDLVDFLGVDKVSGAVVLTLVDDCDWHDELRHLRLLQEKLNRYFDFIESGEVFGRLRETTGSVVAAGVPIRLSILAKYLPTVEGQRLLDEASRVAAELGTELMLKVLGTS